MTEEAKRPSKGVGSAKIRQILNALESVELTKINPEYFQKQIEILFASYVHTGLILPPGWGRLHRAIKHKTRPATTAFLQHPPKDLASSGRANRKGCSVFYCSGDPRASIFEIDAKANDTLVLSKWVMKDDVVIFPLGYTDEAFKRLCSARSCPVLVPTNKKDQRELRGSNKRLTALFDRIFTETTVDPEGERLYELTSIIAEIFLRTNAECGIVFPSMAMHANAENIVLNPGAVNNQLVLESAKWYKVDEAKDFSYTLTLLATASAFSASGEIEWHLPTEEERLHL